MVTRLISTLKGTLIGIMIPISLLVIYVLSSPTLQVGFKGLERFGLRAYFAAQARKPKTLNLSEILRDPLRNPETPTSLFLEYTLNHIRDPTTI